jgi:hypothetical protein
MTYGAIALAAPLTNQWRSDLLEGVMGIKGTWADGSPMLAIPHYARLNRGAQVPVAGDTEPAKDHSSVTTAHANTPKAKRPVHPGPSMVWIKDQ